eukprot:CAMPEP_0204605866 /NCGR_PEP_ID=MMETSP0661-20131031/58739_1 /ASSEMBLY_ACC=CAM_ASM_000606 /TAXON_ID=109239 /ORGANISM="Alexandrium margalefi, Strain AMGDE01CS-322" /LENGTH=232 /DNA_ID=CAMNT_0051617139 /DNA_START=74 /DNA_END=772 /DNA_ORIENTATION=+
MALRSSIAAAACLILSRGHQVSIDDQSSLVQRLVEEPSKPSPIIEFVPDPVALKKAQDAQQKFLDNTWNQVKATNKKFTDARKKVKKSYNKEMLAATNRINTARKHVENDLVPLWRKEKNSSDYGVLDGAVEKFKTQFESRRAKKMAEVLVKTDEMSKRMRDNFVRTIPQPMLPAMTPVAGSQPSSAAPIKTTDDDLQIMVAKARETERAKAKRQREAREAAQKAAQEAEVQ